MTIKMEGEIMNRKCVLVLMTAVAFATSSSALQAKLADAQRDLEESIRTGESLNARIASMTAWATASPSEWPERPGDPGISTPPRIRGLDESKRWESYPNPTRMMILRFKWGGQKSVPE